MITVIFIDVNGITGWYLLSNSTWRKIKTFRGLRGVPKKIIFLFFAETQNQHTFSSIRQIRPGPIFFIILDIPTIHIVISLISHLIWKTHHNNQKIPLFHLSPLLKTTPSLIYSSHHTTPTNPTPFSWSLNTIWVISIYQFNASNHLKTPPSPGDDHQSSPNKRHPFFSSFISLEYHSMRNYNIYVTKKPEPTTSRPPRCHMASPILMI